MIGEMVSMGGGMALGTLVVKLTSDTVSLVNGLNQAEGKLTASCAAMTKAAMGMSAAVVAAFAAVGAAGVREFSKFEDAMTKATSIMGNMSTRQRKELEETARELAKNSTKSAAQLAEAYYFLFSAGLSVEQSQKALGVVAKFASAGMFDLNSATTLLVDSQSALGLRSADAAENMRQMTRVADVLSKANMLANANIQQFSEALTNHAAAAMRAAKVELEEGVAVLAALADRGIKGAEAGSQLHMVLRDLQRAALSNAAEFQRLGVEVFTAGGDLRKLADIFRDFERVLGPMSVAQRRATFELLGFQDRSLAAILSLIGASDAIRKYETALRSAGGATEETSERLKSTLSAQLAILKNRFVDLLITVGEHLTPLLMALNNMFKEATDSSEGFGSGVKAAMEWITPVLREVVALSGDVIWGWQLLFNVGRAGFAKLGADILYTFSILGPTVGKVMEGVVNTIIRGINLAIRAVNALLPEARRMSEIGLRLQTDWEKLGPAWQGMAETASESWAKVREMVEKGPFSQRFREEYRKVTQTVVEENKSIVDSTQQTVQQNAAALDKMAEDTKWAMEQMSLIGTPGEGRGDVLWQFRDLGTYQAQRLAEELQSAKDSLSLLQELNEMDLQLTEEAQKRKLEMLEAYNQRVRELQMAQAMIVTQAASQMFGDLAEIGKAFAGEQSDLYKTMFAISKAFAIADAIVKIQQGIASAASLPFPANLAAMASVVAATASIVSNIQAVKLEFAGERAAGGPVQRGRAFLVGERGPELFVPSQSGNILPNERLAGGVRVEVHNYSGQPVDVMEQDQGRLIEIVVGKARAQFASEIREGRGSIAKALETTFRMKRAGDAR